MLVDKYLGWGLDRTQQPCSPPDHSAGRRSGDEGCLPSCGARPVTFCPLIWGRRWLAMAFVICRQDTERFLLQVAINLEKRRAQKARMARDEGQLRAGYDPSHRHCKRSSQKIQTHVIRLPAVFFLGHLYMTGRPKLVYFCRGCGGVPGGPHY